jgi:hypothetical protein
VVLDRAAADAQREAAPRTGEGRLLGKAFSQFVEIEQLRCDFPDNKKSISSAAAAPYYTPDDECKGNGDQRTQQGGHATAMLESRLRDTERRGRVQSPNGIGSQLIRHVLTSLDSPCPRVSSVRCAIVA